MKKILFISAIIAATLFTSCRKDRIVDEPTAPETFEELSVPNSFDWKTTKDVSLTISATAQGIVEVTNAQQIAYQKAYLSPGMAYTMKLTVPSYENTVRLKFKGFETTLELTSPQLSYTFQ